MNNLKMKTIRLCLLGDSLVGDTCICRALLGFEFEKDTLQTVGYEK